jgi:hypothetical protein
MRAVCERDLMVRDVDVVDAVAVAREVEPARAVEHLRFDPGVDLERQAGGCLRNGRGEGGHPLRIPTNVIHAADPRQAHSCCLFEVLGDRRMPVGERRVDMHVLAKVEGVQRVGRPHATDSSVLDRSSSGEK